LSAFIIESIAGIAAAMQSWSFDPVRAASPAS
jgi:hypothetical protein